MKSKAYLTCSRSVVKKRNNNIDNKGPFNDPRSIALRGFAFCVVGLKAQQTFVHTVVLLNGKRQVYAL